MGLQRIIGKGVVGGALVALAVACSHVGESGQVPAHSAIVRPSAPRRARVVVVVPALLGLSVDALARQLGPPQPVPAPVQKALSQLPSTDPADSVRFFRYRSLDVLVSYNAATRRPNDLLLLGSDEDLLMQRAGLSAEASNYLLLPAFHVRHPMQMLGLRVVPIGSVLLR